VHEALSDLLTKLAGLEGATEGSGAGLTGELAEQACGGKLTLLGELLPSKEEVQGSLALLELLLEALLHGLLRKEVEVPEGLLCKALALSLERRGETVRGRRGERA